MQHNFQQQAKELWGERWKSGLASFAQVNRRTVQRWANGEYPVKPEILRKIDETYQIWRSYEKVAD